MAVEELKKKFNFENTRQISEITENANAYMNDKRQANKILDIIIKLEVNDEDTVLASIQALEMIFCKLVQTRELYFEDNYSDATDNLTPEKKYKIWLNELYNDVKLRLITFFETCSEQILVQALTTLLIFIEEEGKSPISKHSQNGSYFPIDSLEAIINGYLSERVDMKLAILKFQTYLQYHDVKFYLLKCIKKIIKISLLNDPNEIYLNNCFTLMKLIDFKCEDEKTSEDGTINILCNRDDVEKGDGFKFNELEAKKIFRSLWLTFLKTKLPIKLYKKVLYSLDEKVIPYMDRPLLLTDFLMDSYNKGGVCSILALNGIFVLMHKHNLEFPEFYKNLYALFQPRVLHTEYRARFFYLSDIFLSSTHLPEYLIAAFIKRLSRLALTAPSPCLLLIIHFIRNLLIRHKSLGKMISDPKCFREYENDPYDMNDPDPIKCNAINSSLWELKDLQNHYNPDVAFAAKLIDKPLPPMETSIVKFLEISFDTMIDKEGRRYKHAKEFPLNHKKLKVQSREEFLGAYWMFDKLTNLESNLI